MSCAVNATDADGIARVEWYLDGWLNSTETSSPFDTCKLTLTAGTHETQGGRH